MTPDEVNALPERVRRYIHALETFVQRGDAVRREVLLRDENAQLRALVGELQKDAERWRWFRANGDSWHGPTRPAWCYFEIGIEPEQLDAAIDAAMGAETLDG